jgi:hypothetical protein
MEGDVFPAAGRTEGRGQAPARPSVVLTVGRRRAWDVLFGSLVALLLAAVFLAFRAFVLREIAWAYPFDYDQTKYLWISYTAPARSIT